jgi:hypothetical protein
MRIVECEAELLELGLIELEHVVLFALVLVDRVSAGELAEVVLLGAFIG